MQYMQEHVIVTDKKHVILRLIKNYILLVEAVGAKNHCDQS